MLRLIVLIMARRQVQYNAGTQGPGLGGDHSKINAGSVEVLDGSNISCQCELELRGCW